MITEEKREKLLELTQMVRTFAEKNDIEVFMVPSITEEGEEDTDQAASMVLIGTAKYLTSSIVGCIRSNPMINIILTTAVNCADEVEYNKFNVTKR